jgi:hypothetical protein
LEVAGGVWASTHGGTKSMIKSTASKVMTRRFIRGFKEEDS